MRWKKTQKKQGQEKTASWPGWTMWGIFNPKDILNIMCASSAAQTFVFGSCKNLKQTESSKEQNVQKLDFQFQMKQRRTCRFSFFNMAWSCLIVYAPAVLKLIGPGRLNGCRGYSPSGVKQRTGLVSLLLSRLASRLQPWLTLGRGIRLPLADPPPRENTKKRAERKKR